MAFVNFRYLNPGLVSLLTNGTATQSTDPTYSTTGVAIGIGSAEQTITVPSFSGNPNTQPYVSLVLDIYPPNVASSTLEITMPYSNYFKWHVIMTNTGTIQFKSIFTSGSYNTTPVINLADYGVNPNKPVRCYLSVGLKRSNVSTETRPIALVGNYQYLDWGDANKRSTFDGSYNFLKIKSTSSDVFYVSNIIFTDGALSLNERIVPLPVSTTDTDMTESNGLYSATDVDQMILQTPDVAALIDEFGGASSVTGILLVGNPAYKTGDGLTTLTGIDKTNNVITEHKTITLGNDATDAISNNWAPTNMTLNDLANHQFGWKAGAPS